MRRRKVSHKKNFEGYETSFDDKTLDLLFDKVRKKLLKSSEKYGETYWLNNIEKELIEEIVDVLGWTTLEAVRLLNMVTLKFENLDKIYWEKFLHLQDNKFLQELINKIVTELSSRKVPIYISSNGLNAVKKRKE
jgi:hypothetical protein